MPSAPAQQQIEIALAHHQAGRLPEAERIYRAVLVTDPKNPDALHYLGVMAGQIGQPVEALRLLIGALEQQPMNPNIYVNLAMTYLQLQQPDNAAGACEKAIKLQPDWPEVQNIYGNCFYQQGKFDEAIAIYQKTLEQRPDYLAVLSNLGACYKAKGDLPAAVDCCRKILAQAPQMPEPHNNLAIILAEDGQLDEAIAEVQKAIAINPHFGEGWNTLGQLLHQQGSATDEIVAYNRAIATNVHEAAYQINLATALLQQGRVEEALEVQRRAVSIAPHVPQVHANMLMALSSSPAHSARDIYEAHLDWSRRHTDKLPKFSDFSNAPDPGRPIRIGYVSPDFRAHPVGTFIEPILAHHDPQQVQVFCYSSAARSDAVTRRIRALNVTWRDVATISDVQFCEQIRKDGIDILVDLAGHTSGNRLLAFARRPAPIQITYLGYPATTGISEIDYRLTDGRADPPRLTEKYHTETLIRLPDTFLCFRAPDIAPPVSPAPAIKNGFVTFASFANLSKLNDPLIALWSRVLQRSPASKLLLKSLGLGDDGLRQQIITRFAANNIAADRLELRPLDPTRDAHFASFAGIDITLDTFPYAGTTTTCESLYMGVPVVTLTGESHRSRVGHSILETVGVPHLIAADESNYIDIAANLASDVHALNKIRQSLRPQMQLSPLMNEKRSTRNLEQIYREIWQRWCSTR
ncbi:MAG TPA: tetratricopeptide repeat protein [Tepidisphaeraceae bacterium]|jgi:predicted O-linked N-acetylglucosamine transferase (SPINDLY family)